MKKIILCFMFFFALSFGGEIRGFINKKKLVRDVYLPHPEKNPLAKYLIENGFNIFLGRKLNVLEFEIETSSNSVSVYIYYISHYSIVEKEFIGEFEYIFDEQESRNPDEFAKKFVEWLVKNLQSSNEK